jgi:hypothetical protein
MVKLGSTVMTHEEVQKVLPWYANKRLDADTSRHVETHLAACALCRGDVAGLSAVLETHERALPDRPVNEARLDALFGRIDHYESDRRRSSQRAERVSLLARAVQWITVRPALAAGSLAAVLLAVFMVPVVFQAQEPVGQQFQVLSTKGAESARFVVRIHFKAPSTLAEIERAVAASAGGAAELPKYRIEQRSPTEYAVVFDSKPSVAVVGQVLTQLGGMPNIANAAIDEAAAP